MIDRSLLITQEQRRIAVLTGSMLDAETALRLCSTPPEKRDQGLYNTAQSNEKASFRAALYHLAKSLAPDIDVGPATGRPPTPMSDVLFTVVYKVYSGLSARRFMTDLRDLQAFGFVSQVMSPNSVSDYLSKESFSDTLQALIALTAAPFSHIEQNFAIDSTGFRIPKINKWYDEKYGWRQRRQWVKCHACVGVKSHIITAVKVTQRQIGDSPVLPELADATAENFEVSEIAADGAYLSVKNLEHLDASGIFPAIPFHSNHKVYSQPTGSVWRKMFHLFALNSDEYQDAINRQAQVESTFSMIKRKFGEKIYSKSQTGQLNEVLCKVLCHNLCVMIYWLYQFGVELPESFHTADGDQSMAKGVLLKPSEKNGRPAKGRHEHYESLKQKIRTWWNDRLQVGEALREIRDDKLYQHEHQTFEEFCLSEYGFERAHAYRLIGFAEVKETLKMSPIGDKIKAESQARALAPVPQERRVEVLQEVVAKGPVTAKAITEVADRVAPKSIKQTTAKEPVKEKHLDKTGYVIPDSILSDWQLAESFRSTLSDLQRIKLQIEKAIDKRDLIFREVGQDTVADLKNAWTALKQVLPYAVCPTCQGRTRDKCSVCKQRGFVSEFGYTHWFAKEVIDLREKAIKK